MMTQYPDGRLVNTEDERQNNILKELKGNSYRGSAPCPSSVFLEMKVQVK